MNGIAHDNYNIKTDEFHRSFNRTIDNLSQQDRLINPQTPPTSINQVPGLSTAKKEDLFRQELLRIVRERYSDIYPNPEKFSNSELESITLYGSPNAIYQQEYDYAPSIREDGYGRIQLGTERMNIQFKEYQDTRIAMKLGGNSMRNRVIRTIKRDRYAYRKKLIKSILSTLPPKFKIICKFLIEEKLLEIVEFTSKFYKPVIKKFLAALIYKLSKRFNVYVQIRELIDSLNISRKGIMGFYPIIDSLELVPDINKSEKDQSIVRRNRIIADLNKLQNKYFSVEELINMIDLIDEFERRYPKIKNLQNFQSEITAILIVKLFSIDVTMKQLCQTLADIPDQAPEMGKKIISLLGRSPQLREDMKIGYKFAKNAVKDQEVENMVDQSIEKQYQDNLIVDIDNNDDLIKIKTVLGDYMGVYGNDIVNYFEENYDHDSSSQYVNNAPMKSNILTNIDNINYSTNSIIAPSSILINNQDSDHGFEVTEIEKTVNLSNFNPDKHLILLTDSSDYFIHMMLQWIKKGACIDWGNTNMETELHKLSLRYPNPVIATLNNQSIDHKNCPPDKIHDRSIIMYTPIFGDISSWSRVTGPHRLMRKIQPNSNIQDIEQSLLEDIQSFSFKHADLIICLDQSQYSEYINQISNKTIVQTQNDAVIQNDTVIQNNKTIKKHVINYWRKISETDFSEPVMASEPNGNPKFKLYQVRSWIQWKNKMINAIEKIDIQQLHSIPIHQKTVDANPALINIYHYNGYKGTLWRYLVHKVRAYMQQFDKERPVILWFGTLNEFYTNLDSFLQNPHGLFGRWRHLVEDYDFRFVDDKLFTTIEDVQHYLKYGPTIPKNSIVVFPHLRRIIRSEYKSHTLEIDEKQGLIQLKDEMDAEVINLSDEAEKDILEYKNMVNKEYNLGMYKKKKNIVKKLIDAYIRDRNNKLQRDIANAVLRYELRQKQFILDKSMLHLYNPGEAEHELIQAKYSDRYYSTTAQDKLSQLMIDIIQFQERTGNIFLLGSELSFEYPIHNLDGDLVDLKEEIRLTVFDRPNTISQFKPTGNLMEKLDFQRLDNFLLNRENIEMEMMITTLLQPRVPNKYLIARYETDLFLGHLWSATETTSIEDLVEWI